MLGEVLSQLGKRGRGRGRSRCRKLNGFVGLASRHC